MTLSDEQRAAVARTGQDVCVVAGPGSGKTRVLVERFRWRIENRFSPLRILAVTFTDKAAAEIKQRLAEHFSAQPELREQLERAHVSTVHGFCARLLKEHAIAAGLDPEFQVLEAAEAAAERRAAAVETLDALFTERPEAVRPLLRAVAFSDPADELATVYEARRLLLGESEPRAAAGAADLAALREALRAIVAAEPPSWNDNQRSELAHVQAWCRRALALPPAGDALDHLRVLSELRTDLRRLKAGPLREAIKEARDALTPVARQALIGQYYAPQRALLEEALERLDSRYRERKLALNALDFADLEEQAIRLLRAEALLRERVRESFDEILMDELQDTNPLQAALIDLLRRPDRFFAVGDINQSIYGFRQAEPEVFRRYRRELESRAQVVDRLRENHRSRPEILTAVDAILSGAAGIEPHELVATGKFAEKPEPSVEVIAAVAATTEEAAVLEAQWVARRIRDLTAGGAVRFSDVAVLVRNVKVLPAFEAAFHDFDVPYVIARGKGFYEAQEVTDLNHWLRVLANPRDEISLAAVARSPLVGVSDETLMRLKQSGSLAGALERFDDQTGDAERLIWFREQLRAVRAQADELSPDRLLARIIDASGYENALNARARANVRKFLALVRDAFARRPRPLAALIEELADRRAADPDEATAPLEGALNAVQLMTIHAAKGLEFPVVFVAALHKGVAHDSPPLAFSPSAGLVARWRDPITGEGVKDSSYAVFSDELKRKEQEEESRLLYVAMTRAKEHLVLSFAATEKGARNWAERVVAGLGLDLKSGVAAAPERPAPRAAETAAAIEERLPRPALTAQHDASISVTDVWLFAHCPRKYFLARYLGWEQPATQARMPVPPLPESELHAAELGRQVHDLLAGLSVKEPAPEAAALASRFQASDLGRRAARAQRCEHEYDFLMDLDDVVLEGRIDLWFEESDELVLVDSKTDNVAASEAAERARSYALQLQLYALALERHAGRLPDRAVISLLRPNVEVDMPLRPEELEAARAAVHALRQAQHTMSFPPCTGEHCYRCAYFRALCPARAAATA